MYMKAVFLFTSSGHLSQGRVPTACYVRTYAYWAPVPGHS